LATIASSILARFAISSPATTPKAASTTPARAKRLPPRSQNPTPYPPRAVDELPQDRVGRLLRRGKLVRPARPTSRKLPDQGSLRQGPLPSELHRGTERNPGPGSPHPSPARRPRHAISRSTRLHAIPSPIRQESS